MGYIRHNAILVTGNYDNWASKAREKALNIFSEDLVSYIMKSPINRYETFFVAPDGSKEGWDESDIGDKHRAEFIAWLNAQKYDDNSSPLAWVEIQYGDDEGQTIVINHSN